MKRWQLWVSAYLISVPLPYLILNWLGIQLAYEHLGFWLVQLYAFPLWLISEPLGVPAPWVTLSMYWALVLSIVGLWAISGRRSRVYG